MGPPLSEELVLREYLHDARVAHTRHEARDVEMYGGGDIVREEVARKTRLAIRLTSFAPAHVLGKLRAAEGCSHNGLEHKSVDASHITRLCSRNNREGQA
jgi:hypothetical protein